MKCHTIPGKLGSALGSLVSLEKEFKELERQRALADLRRDLGSILRPHAVDNNIQ